MATSTKVMSVRLPLAEYMDLLQKASESNMTVTDYALQLIYYNKNKPLSAERHADTVKELIATKNQLQALTKKFNDAVAVNKQLASNETTLQAKIKRLEIEIENKEGVAEHAKQELAQFKNYAENYLVRKDGR